MFAVILSLGMFCAVGCKKPAPPQDKPVEVEEVTVMEEGVEAPAADNAAKEGEAAEAPAPAEKPAEQ